MTPRRYSCLLVLAGLTVLARAEDKAPPPPSDGISSAKKEFDSIKNSRTPLDQPRMEVPSVSAPTLHLADELSGYNQAEAFKKKERDARKSKSNNWLVDAMQEKRDAAKKPPEAFKTEEERGETTLLTLNADESARTAAKASEAVPKGSPPPDNPLTTYMSSWMTSKDYDLLKVKSPETSDSSIPTVATERGAEPTLFDGFMRGTTSGSTVGKASVSPEPERGRNPYLADFGPVPATPAKDFSAPPLSAAIDLGTSSPPKSVQKGDPAAVRPGTAPADALKPSTDSKYFPQLKRF